MKFNKTTYRPSSEADRALAQRFANRRRVAKWRLKYHNVGVRHE